jgi:hypothetical protein
LLFAARQTRNLAQQTKTGNAVGAATIFAAQCQLLSDAHAPLIANPALRAYFYDGKECPTADPHRQQLLTIAELMADAAECGLVVSEVHTERWVEYPRYLLERSPLVREVVRDRRFWRRLSSMLAEPPLPGDG